MSNLDKTFEEFNIVTTTDQDRSKPHTGVRHTSARKPEIAESGVGLEDIKVDIVTSEGGLRIPAMMMNSYVRDR